MLMQMDFEGQWAMLMGILPDGAGAADMLCRILVAIDEDIVSLDIPRSPDGIKASMEFKVIIMHTCVASPILACPFEWREADASRTASAGMADMRYGASHPMLPSCWPVRWHSAGHCKHACNACLQKPSTCSLGQASQAPNACVVLQCRQLLDRQLHACNAGHHAGDLPD